MFDNSRVTAPAGLTTPTFRLRPLTTADVELDHAAVMESKEYLRHWEQSTWPEDDFTVDANLEDLVTCEQRHAEGRAFTYTVMNHDETECLGCVYVLSPGAKMFEGGEATDIGDDRWADCDATVFLRVRASRLPEQLDRTLLDALVAWFDSEWSFEAPVFVTNEQFEQQVAMFDGTELRRRFEIRVPDEPGAYLAYA